MNAITIYNQDILDVPCDILILKYSQGFFGADLEVAKTLNLSKREDDALAPGNYMRIPTNGKLPCKRVLFIGVRPLWDFGYTEIRNFAQDALTILESQDCEKDRLAMTMHGVGYGLDEKEAFTAQVAGLMEYQTSRDNA